MDNELLLKDLCARLPYGVLVCCMNEYNYISYLTTGILRQLQSENRPYVILPYLRPMSSMTEEEKKEVSILLNYEFYIDDDCALVTEDDRHRIRLDLIQVYIDWLNSHHFDFRGLIEKKLALTAKEGMYK